MARTYPDTPAGRARQIRDAAGDARSMRKRTGRRPR